MQIHNYGLPASGGKERSTTALGNIIINADVGLHGTAADEGHGIGGGGNRLIR